MFKVKVKISIVKIFLPQILTALPVEFTKDIWFIDHKINNIHKH